MLQMTRAGATPPQGARGKLATARSLALGVASLVFWSPARAGAEASRWDVALGTRVPADVSASAGVELPGRIGLRASVGFLPAAYVDRINATAKAFSWYGDTEAKLLARALQRSTVWGLGVGFRPLAAYGWTIETGYVLASLGGSTSIQEALTIASGQPSPDRQPRREYELSVTNHFLALSTSYRHALSPRWSVSASLGVLATLATSASVQPQFEVRAQRLQDGFTQGVEGYLVDLMEKYVHSPTLGVSVHYQL